MLKPHKIYSDTIEGKALAQFHEALKQDCVMQGALMPDAHAGYTLPIGAVIATDGVVFPSAVGYDIGCGVLGIPTTFKVDEVREHAKAIFDQIYRDVPVGFSHHASAQDWTYRGPTTHVVRKILEDGGLRQLGTLGGNHQTQSAGSPVQSGQSLCDSQAKPTGLRGEESAKLTLASTKPRF